MRSAERAMRNSWLAPIQIIGLSRYLESFTFQRFRIPRSAFRIFKDSAFPEKNYCPAPWTGMSPFCPNGYPKNVEKFVLLLAMRKFPFDGRQIAMSDFPSLS
jgi:hypothetical protein